MHESYEQRIQQQASWLVLLVFGVAYGLILFSYSLSGQQVPWSTQLLALFVAVGFFTYTVPRNGLSLKMPWLPLNDEQSATQQLIPWAIVGIGWITLMIHGIGYAGNLLLQKPEEALAAGTHLGLSVVFLALSYLLARAIQAGSRPAIHLGQLAYSLIASGYVASLFLNAAQLDSTYSQTVSTSGTRPLALLASAWIAYTLYRQEHVLTVPKKHDTDLSVFIALFFMPAGYIGLQILSVLNPSDTTYNAPFMSMLWMLFPVFVFWLVGHGLRILGLRKVAAIIGIIMLAGLSYGGYQLWRYNFPLRCNGIRGYFKTTGSLPELSADPMDPLVYYVNCDYSLQVTYWWPAQPHQVAERGAALHPQEIDRFMFSEFESPKSATLSVLRNPENKPLLELVYGTGSEFKNAAIYQGRGDLVFVVTGDKEIVQDIRTVE